MVSGVSGDIKLTDFGFGAQLTNEQGSCCDPFLPSSPPLFLTVFFFSSAARKSMVGTSYWMAPEVIQSDEYDCKVFIYYRVYGYIEFMLKLSMCGSIVPLCIVLDNFFFFFFFFFFFRWMCGP